MKVVMGEVNGVWLMDIMNKVPENCKSVTATVAYATYQSDFFDRCLERGVFLDFYGLLDENQAVSIEVLEKLVAAGPLAANCSLVKGHYHPKVIWWHGYGVYIGSANLTNAAWSANIECGVFFPEDEVLGTSFQVEVELMFDRIRRASKVVDSNLIKSLKLLRLAGKQLESSRNNLKSKFEDATKTFPQHHGLLSNSGNSKLSLFALEWDETLELLKGLRGEFFALNLRPVWVAADANKTVHFDQFLHAYYYVRVRGRSTRELGDEDSTSAVNRFFAQNKDQKRSALKDAAEWWAALEEAPYGEGHFIANTAPRMQQLFSKEGIASWTLNDFTEAMMGVNAFTMHARQVKNKFFGLPVGHYESINDRTARLAEFIWNDDRSAKKSLKEMWSYLVWGGYPSNVSERLWSVISEEKWMFPRLGQSSLGEAVGWARPNDYPPRNNRTNKALRALGHGSVRLFSSE